jgi:hypothetical protein
VDRNLLKSDIRIVAVAGIVLAEITEGEAVEMPAMGGVAEGAEVGIVRRDDEDLASGANEAVKFFHGFHDVAHVFDHVNGLQGVEGGISERVRKLVELANHVGSAGGVAVDANGSGEFVDAAADVEGSHVRIP